MKKFNKSWVRALCLIMAVLLSAVSFFGCNNGGADNSQTTGTTEYVEPITLASDGKAKVSIVYSITDSSVVSASARSLGASLSERCGFDIPLVIDSLGTTSTEGYEIVVGNTDRASSKAAIEALAPNSYSVTISGKEIIVVASNIYLYSEAVDALLAAITVSDGAMTLAGNYSKASGSYDVLNLIADKKTDYKIIYASADETAKAQATALKNAFFSVAGTTIEIAADFNDATGKEILIGNTSRELSKNSEAYYFSSETKCDLDGNVSVTGNLKAGVDSIIKYIEETYRASGRVDIPKNLFGLVIPSGYGNTPKYEGSGKIKIVEGFESVKNYYVQADGATEEDYKDYAKKLVDSGFKLYYSTQAQSSRFATYTDGYNIVNISYIEYYSPYVQNQHVTYVNIAVDSMEKGALPPLEDNSEKITDIQVALVNSENAFIIRLEDGRFLVIDGGLKKTNEKNNADLIYKYIVENNVLEGRPVIAAWLITHPHSDHVSAYSDFAQRYNNKVDLNMVICNLPNSEMDRVEQSNQVYEGATKQFSNAKYVVAHAGQRFAFAGLDLDVLFTYENLYDLSHVEDSNLSSSIFSLDMTGGRMIIMGDLYTKGCKILNAIYAEGLECDVVQFCHHGYNGGDKEMYEVMGAKVGIWTINYETAVEKGLYGKSSYNNIVVENYDMHLIMDAEDTYMVLTADMSKADLKPFRKFEA